MSSSTVYSSSGKKKSTRVIQANDRFFHSLFCFMTCLFFLFSHRFSLSFKLHRILRLSLKYFSRASKALSITLWWRRQMTCILFTSQSVVDGRGWCLSSYFSSFENNMVIAWEVLLYCWTQFSLNFQDYSLILGCLFVWVCIVKCFSWKGFHVPLHLQVFTLDWRSSQRKKSKRSE